MMPIYFCRIIIQISGLDIAEKADMLGIHFLRPGRMNRFAGFNSTVDASEVCERKCDAGKMWLIMRGRCERKRRRCQITLSVRGRWERELSVRGRCGEKELSVALRCGQAKEASSISYISIRTIHKMHFSKSQPRMWLKQEWADAPDSRSVVAPIE